MLHFQDCKLCFQVDFVRSPAAPICAECEAHLWNAPGFTITAPPQVFAFELKQSTNWSVFLQLDGLLNMVIKKCVEHFLQGKHLNYRSKRVCKRERDVELPADFSNWRMTMVFQNCLQIRNTLIKGNWPVGLKVYESSQIGNCIGKHQHDGMYMVNMREFNDFVQRHIEIPSDIAKTLKDLHQGALDKTIKNLVMSQGNVAKGIKGYALRGL